MDLNQISDVTLIHNLEKKLIDNRSDKYNLNSDSDEIDSEDFDAEVDTHLNKGSLNESDLLLESSSNYNNKLDIDNIIEEINKNDSIIEFSKISDEELSQEISKNMNIYNHNKENNDLYEKNQKDLIVTEAEISHLSKLEEYIESKVISERLINNYCSKSRPINTDTYKYAASLVHIASECFRNNTVNTSLNNILKKNGVVLNMSKKTYTLGPILINVFPKAIIEFILHEYGYVKKDN